MNSKHDFSSDSGNSYAVTDGATEDRMCVFCHTPHNAVENIPLWNRSGQTGTYELYTSSATLTSAVKNSVITSDNISYKCLSCHDGTITIGGTSVVNGDIGGTGEFLSGTALIMDGESLTDDHPIGFDYSRVSANGDAAGIKTVAEVTGTVKFYKAGTTKTNQMECASCHDVHGQAAPGTKFLRTSNTGSALCLTCHIK
ncbi:MAG: cytochrome c3 family protein [Proteobacteria bacterium]|nr:cytochrome c3 family protein [Pseudomonadota bacterium]